LAAQTITALKSIKQHFEPPTPELLQMMKTFRIMVNDCIRIGLENDASTRIKLTKLCYHQLARYKIFTQFTSCVLSPIQQAYLPIGKNSIKRGFQPRQPYAARPLLVAYVGFKVVVEGMLKVPLGNRQYFDIPLNDYVKHILSDPSLNVRSFTLAANNTTSRAISKEVDNIEECVSIEGIDRNLYNVTIGNCQKVRQYDLSKAV
jgi:putative transposase